MEAVRKITCKCQRALGHPFAYFLPPPLPTHQQLPIHIVSSLNRHKMPLFVLSPASLAHSALFAGYYTYLGTNVMALRIKTGVMLGDGGAGSIRDAKHKAGPSDAVDEAKLKRGIRAHANFSETTPFAFFLIFLAELNGAPTSLVHGAYTALLASRVLHAELGLKTDDVLGIGRPVGIVGTWLITLAAGAYNLNLGYEPLKSFLGFK